MFSMAYKGSIRVLNLSTKCVRSYTGLIARKSEHFDENFSRCSSLVILSSHVTPVLFGPLYHFSTVNRDIQSDSCGNTQGSTSKSKLDAEDDSNEELLDEDWFEDLDDKTPLPAKKFSEEEKDNPLRFNRKERIKACLSKLKKGSDGRYINVFEVATEVDMLIAAFLKLKAKASSIYLDDVSDEEYSLEDIDVDRFKRLQKQLRSGNYEFKPIVRAPPPKSKVKK